MSAKTDNFKIGVFTIIGVGLFVTGLLVFGAWSHFKKTSLFETYVKGEVSGLSVGSPVELRGVRVGKVTGISFSWNEYPDSTPGYVVVDFEINDNVSGLPPGAARDQRLQAAVARGLRARPTAQGVTGTSMLSLEYLDPTEYPALKVPWTPRYSYIPSAPGLLGELLVSMRQALHKLDHVDITELNQMAETDLKSVGRLLDRVERMDLESLNTNANALLTEVRGSNAKFQSFIDDTDGTMKKMELEKLARDSDAAIGQLRETISALEPKLAKIDVDSLNQTLASAQRTLHQADDVLFELKQYPSGFLFGKPPPALKEVQSPAKR
jgi:ABC-type transporter Mla subunit MlaD